MDITVRQGDTLTLAVNGTSNLPAGSVTSGRTPTSGTSRIEPHLPATCRKRHSAADGIATTIDFRNVVQSKLYVDRNIVDAPIDDLSAPASVRSARRRVAAGATPLKPMKVADHVWFMNGNTFFEFDDHITMVEANRTDAALPGDPRSGQCTRARQARHAGDPDAHHFDHSVGLRAAVAEGLTVISRRGNEGIFREMVARPAKLFPDALGRSPKPLKFIPVDDHLKLKDSTNEIDIYHIIGNYHMADGVIVHVRRRTCSSKRTSPLRTGTSTGGATA